MADLVPVRNSSRIHQHGRTTDGNTSETLPTNRTHSRTPSSDESANIIVLQRDPPPYEEVARGETIASSQPSPPPAYEAVVRGQFPELQTGSDLIGSDLTGNEFPEVVNQNGNDETGT